MAVQAQAGRRLAVGQLQGQHAHADEVRAMDALEAGGQHRSDAEERRPLGRPVPGGAGAVVLSSHDDEGNTFGRVARGRLVDRHLLPVGEVDRHPALRPRRQLVAEPDVGEGAPDHDLVVAAARPIGVEVDGVDTRVDEPPTRRTVSADDTGGRDVVRGH